MGLECPTQETIRQFCRLQLGVYRYMLCRRGWLVHLGCPHCTLDLSRCKAVTLATGAQSDRPEFETGAQTAPPPASAHLSKYLYTFLPDQSLWLIIAHAASVRSIMNFTNIIIIIIIK